MINDECWSGMNIGEWSMTDGNSLALKAHGSMSRRLVEGRILKGEDEVFTSKCEESQLP
jgi:hypothetical protein